MVQRDGIEIRLALKEFDLPAYLCGHQNQAIPKEQLLHEVWGAFSETELMADEKRLGQVLENLIGNAKKYAPDTEITIWAERNREEQRYEIYVRDHRRGIPPEDTPFICKKFYRGRSAENAPGSGLGLYIVTYIMERKVILICTLNSYCQNLGFLIFL